MNFDDLVRDAKELGGTDNIENIVISCPLCNLRKGNKTEEEFYAFLSDIKISA